MFLNFIGIEALLQSIGDGIILTDISENIIFMNDAAERLTEWSSEEAVGKNLSTVFNLRNKSQKDCENNIFNSVIEQKKAIGLKKDTVLITAFGNERYISASNAPLYNEERKIIGIVVVFRDITHIENSIIKRFKLEKMLNDISYNGIKADNLDLFIEDTLVRLMNDLLALKVSLYEFNEDDNKFYISNSIPLERSYEGWMLNSVAHKELYTSLKKREVIKYEDINEINTTQGNEVLLENKGISAIILPLFIKDKLYGFISFYYERKNIYLKEEDMELLQAMGRTICSAIERQIFTVELKETILKVEEANTAKGEFLANMSHEIRTPLNGVKGMIDLTLMTKLTEEQRGNLLTAKESANNLMNIINDILDFSKISEGKMEILRVPFNLHNLIKRLLRNHSIKADKKGINLNTQIDKDIPEIIVGDGNRLQQVLDNLLSNGIKFTEYGQVLLIVKCVQISGKDKVKIKFSVKDTGIGISNEEMKYLFQRFSQIDGSYTKKYNGSGLGLVISQKLVELMGGRIMVDSNKNLGSTFYFTLEFNNLYVIGNYGEKYKLQKEINLSRALKILIVEDNKVSRKLLENIMEKEGFEVNTASCGIKALEYIQAQTFDLVLMDIQMPDIDGVETTLLVRKIDQAKKAYTPVIAVTSYALKGDREKFIAAGLDGYISKPIKVSELLSEISNVLSKKVSRFSKGLAEGVKIAYSEDNERVLLKYLKELKAVIDMKDIEQVRKLAHLVKEIGGENNDETLKNTAFKLELAARKNRSENFEILLSLLVELISQRKMKE